jgi:hypothetical protein
LRLYDFPRFRDVVVPQSAALRNLRTIFERPRSTLLGGGFGLARWQGTTFSFLTAARIPALKSVVVGIATTPEGYTWLMAGRNIVRIADADLDHAFDDPRWIPPALVYDFHDGLTGTANRDGKRDAVRGGDGRLWFATSAGTLWIDPANLRQNRTPPPLAISAVHVDSQTFRDPKSVSIASGVRRVAIDFSILSFSVPQRLIVRYQLEGVDNGWVDAGTSRSAAYTNLSPGRYRFHVIGANEDGVWNKDGATLEFRIAPTFVQSVWFMMLCLAGSVLLLWAAFSIRARQLTARVRDNGRGLPEEVATTGSRPGHFGLLGMRERAERAGGKLAIASRPGKGTEVYVTVPGRLAYVSRRTQG